MRVAVLGTPGASVGDITPYLPCRLPALVVKGWDGISNAAFIYANWHESGLEVLVPEYEKMPAGTKKYREQAAQDCEYEIIRRSEFVLLFVADGEHHIDHLIQFCIQNEIPHKSIYLPPEI